jgi:hypothetical protein
LAGRGVVALIVLVLMVRTLWSFVVGGPDVGQAFAAGLVAAQVLDQRPRR